MKGDSPFSAWSVGLLSLRSRIVTESVMLMDVDSLNLASIFILDDLYERLETF